MRYTLFDQLKNEVLRIQNSRTNTETSATISDMARTSVETLTDITPEPLHILTNNTSETVNKMAAEGAAMVRREMLQRATTSNGGNRNIEALNQIANNLNDAVNAGVVPRITSEGYGFESVVRGAAEFASANPAAAVSLSILGATTATIGFLLSQPRVTDKIVDYMLRGKGFSDILDKIFRKW